MGTQTVASPLTQRIGKVKGEILAHVMPQEVIGKVGVSMKKTMPKNAGETVSFRRFLPKGATTSSPNIWSVDPAAHRLTEGETPLGETVNAQDIEATLSQFHALYRYSDRVADLYEDDVPGEMKRLVGERMGLVLEMERWGKLRAGTNVFYPLSSVTSRASVGGAAGHLLSAGLFRRVARSLSNNLAPKVTGILDASVKIGTAPIEAAFVVVCHSDLEADLRSQLSGFVHVSEYGNRQVMHENELGSWEQFRFVTSPHLAPYLLQGGTHTAGVYLANGAPNTGSNASDVYPMLVMAEDCYGDVMLRGANAMQVFTQSPGTTSSSDPLGQRGHVGAKTYFTCVRLNEMHMAVLEVPASAL
jgi:N4-gp56 family major capsid protein